jgi:hypothetical protein
MSKVDVVILGAMFPQHDNTELEGQLVRRSEIDKTHIMATFAIGGMETFTRRGITDYFVVLISSSIIDIRIDHKLGVDSSRVPIALERMLWWLSILHFLFAVPREAGFHFFVDLNKGLDRRVFTNSLS